MSVDLFVILAHNDAPDWAAWNQALSTVSPTTSFTAFMDLRHGGGFLPVRLDGRDTGFFFYYGSPKELAAHSKEVARIHVDNPIVYQLSWGGNSDECAAAFLSASVLVSRFGGVAFDPQGGMTLSSKDLTEGASQCLALNLK